MAQIVTITNPLTGQPTQVDQLDHTAQQIDDGLNIARGVSNPNLLDNPYFGNPVDQLGGYIQFGGTMMYKDPELTVEFGASSGTTPVVMYSTYARPIDHGIELKLYIKRSDCVRGYTGGGYGIDRWLSYKTDNVVIITEDGLQLILTDTSSYIEFAQRLPIQPLIGKTVNASFLTASNELATGSTTVSQGMDVNVCFGSKLRLNLYAPTEGVLALRFIGSSETIKAAKLELGSTQTLAHQENGVWVLNEIPDYGEQLRRCQRYFFRFSGDLFTHIVGTDMAYATAWLPVPMRAVPSVSIIKYATDRATPSVATWSSSTTSVLFQSAGAAAQIRVFDANAAL